jgi:UDPglucose 6-dehydrogenase
MRLTIFGSGYVGLVTGVCFAEAGNNVLCVDIDERKVALLQAGESPIFEPGLTEMLRRNIAAKRLSFSADPAEGVRHGLFQFIAVGTPPDQDGAADLKYVVAVAEAIGRHLTDYRIVVTKSTVPVGTADSVKERVEAMLREPAAGGIRCGLQPGIPQRRRSHRRLHEARPHHRGDRQSTHGGVAQGALRSLHAQP